VRHREHPATLGDLADDEAVPSFPIR
jgi:hypothetical protein